jgi:aspartyl-tRNA(Asn)/glutamyl-tRNA(Gln) amidotransferase subunit C
VTRQNPPQIDIRHVAKLARLALTEDEISRYEGELSSILDYVNELSDLPTKDVAATAQVIASTDVVREDIVAPGLTREAFLAGAPASQVGMVRVPRILAEA